MNREILFRGKSTGDLSPWIYGYYHYDNATEGHYICDKDTLYQYEVDPDTIGQFTGFMIKDVQLWESDIVRIEEDGDEDDNRNYYVCTWVKEWAMFALLHTENEYHQYLEKGVEALDEFLYWTYVFDEKENVHKNICGNIFSNPELIKEG